MTQQQELALANDRLACAVAARLRQTWPYLRRLDPSDCVQEARLALLVAAAGFDPSRGVRFATYAYHVILARLRRAAYEQGGVVRVPACHERKPPRCAGTVRALQAALGTAQPVPLLLVSRQHQPDEQVAQADEAAWRRRRLRQLLRRLPTEERAAIRLTVLDGLTCRAAADLLEVSHETVRKRRRQGLARLRRQLGGLSE